MPSESY